MYTVYRNFFTGKMGIVGHTAPTAVEPHPRPSRASSPDNLPHFMIPIYHTPSKEDAENYKNSHTENLPDLHPVAYHAFIAQARAHWQSEAAENINRRLELV